VFVIGYQGVSGPRRVVELFALGDAKTPGAWVREAQPMTYCRPTALSSVALAAWSETA